MAQGKITEADTPTIRLGATPSKPISDTPPSSPHFYAGRPSCHNPPTLSWLWTGTKYAGLHTQWRLRWHISVCCMLMHHGKKTNNHTFLNGAAEKKQLITTTNRAMSAAETTDHQVSSHSCIQNKPARYRHVYTSCTISDGQIGTVIWFKSRYEYFWDSILQSMIWFGPMQFEILR